MGCRAHLVFGGLRLEVRNFEIKFSRSASFGRHLQRLRWCRRRRSGSARHFIPGCAERFVFARDHCGYLQRMLRVTNLWVVRDV